LGEMAARRNLVAWAGLDRSIGKQHIAGNGKPDMATAGGNPIPSRRNTDD